VRADGALNGSERRFCKGEDSNVRRAQHSSGPHRSFWNSVLLLALYWKGFWKTFNSRKKSLSKAYVINYLCLLVYYKIKIEWVVLTEQHRNSSWLEMKSAQLEHTQRQMHVK